MPGPRRIFRRISAPFFYPLEVLRGLTDGVGARLESSAALRAALREAEERAARAELAARRAEEARLESARLQEALAARAATSLSFATEPLLARVIGRAPHPRQWRLTLDLGTDHGVTQDSPVLYGDDLLGRVVEVSARRSRVLLVQDPLSALGVLIEGHRSPGVAQGTGAGVLALTDVPADVSLTEGDRVLTGSLSAYFPKGLVVGALVRRPDGTLGVRPRRDPLRIEEAFVLPLARPGAASSPETKPSSDS